MKKTLEEINELVRSLHSQPPLSDSLPEGRWIWVFDHPELARLKFIPTVNNEQTKSI